MPNYYGSSSRPPISSTRATAGASSSTAPSAMAESRRNQYFIPGDGIAREVITADICKYLDNDALVRPGNYQGIDGYYIFAYRNLTKEMIDDLKQDSRRWDNEKREKQTVNPRARLPARGQPAAIQSARGAPLGSRSPDYYPETYVQSRTHQTRQEIGPSVSDTPSPAYSASARPPPPNPSSYRSNPSPYPESGSYGGAADYGSGPHYSSGGYSDTTMAEAPRTIQPTGYGGGSQSGYGSGGYGSAPGMGGGYDGGYSNQAQSSMGSGRQNFGAPAPPQTVPPQRGGFGGGYSDSSSSVSGQSRGSGYGASGSSHGSHGRDSGYGGRRH